MNKNHIQLYEHQFLHVDDTFKRHHFQHLIRYGAKNNYKYFQIYNDKVKFCSYVGVIQVEDLTIEVLPKADSNANSYSINTWHNVLIDLLRETNYLNLDAITNSYLDINKSSLFDLYIETFIGLVDIIIKEGLKKYYYSYEDNINKFKGKIIFSKHINKNLIHKEKQFVKYFIYDKNHDLNKILLKAINILLKTQNKFYFRLKRLAFFFDNIDDIQVDESYFKQIKFTKNNVRYKEAINIAKMILLGNSPLLKNGDENVLAFLIDMNKLFEKFIFQQLKKTESLFSNINLKIHGQIRKRFWKDMTIRPDIIVQYKKDNKEELLVLDAKWKIIKNNKPADDDLKQIYVYNLHFGSGLGILLYPKTFDNIDHTEAFEKSSLIDFNHYCSLMYISILDEHNKLNKNLGQYILNSVIKS